MKGDGYFLFDDFDIINKLTILQNKRMNQNEIRNYYRSQNRQESDSSLEGEGNNDEDLENERIYIFFKFILYN